MKKYLLALTVLGGFTLSAYDANAQVRVYDQRGRQTLTVRPSPGQAPGRYDLRDERGRNAGSIVNGRILDDRGRTVGTVRR
jgi:hypothetical protein